MSSCTSKPPFTPHVYFGSRAIVPIGTRYFKKWTASTRKKKRRRLATDDVYHSGESVLASNAGYACLAPVRPWTRNLAKHRRSGIEGKPVTILLAYLRFSHRQVNQSYAYYFLQTSGRAYGTPRNPWQTTKLRIKCNSLGNSPSLTHLMITDSE